MISPLLIGREVFGLAPLSMRGDHDSVITYFNRATNHIQCRCIHELLELFLQRRESHRDGGKGLTAHNRGGNIISYHIPIGRVRKPLERHRPSKLYLLAPTASPVDRGDEASIQLTGSSCTVGIREVVVGKSEVCLATSSVFIDSDTSSKMINLTADRIDGNAPYRCPCQPIS